MALGLGELLGHTERGPRREDRHLRDGIGVLGERGDDRVARLVHRHRPLLLGEQGIGGVATADQQPVACVREVLCRDHVAVVAHRVDRRLVQEVGQVRAGEAGRGAAHGVKVDVRGEVLVMRVHEQDRGALALVRERDLDGAVKAAGAQQRGIKGLGAVGGRHHDDARRRVEAVHLREHQVEGLLALVIGGKARAASTPDGVDLVDEDDRGGGLAGVREEVPHARRSDADEHLDEARATQREEGDLGLARHGTRHLGLSRARGPHHEDALRPHGAGATVAVGVLQEVDDLRDLLLGALVARDVAEARRRPFLVVELGLGAAEAHDPPSERLLAAPADPDEEPDEEQERKEGEQHRRERLAAGRAAGDAHVVAQ